MYCSSSALGQLPGIHFLAAFLANGFLEIAAGRLRVAWSSVGALLPVLVAFVKGTGLWTATGGWASLPGDLRYGCGGAPSCTCIHACLLPWPQRTTPVPQHVLVIDRSTCTSPVHSNYHAQWPIARALSSRRILDRSGVLATYSVAQQFTFDATMHDFQRCSHQTKVRSLLSCQVQWLLEAPVPELFDSLSQLSLAVMARQPGCVGHRQL